MELQKEIQDITESYLTKNDFNTVDLLFKQANDEMVRLSYRDGRWVNESPNSMIFDLASLTKIVTTTGILRLITEKKLSLQSTLAEHLPLQNSLIEKIGHITIEELLTHSSGLRAWYPFYSLQTRNFLEALAQIEVTHNLERKTVYSDLNFILLGEVIQSNTDMRLDDFVTNKIVKPLELRTLTYGPIKDNENVISTEFGNQTERKMCSKRNISFARWRNFDQAMKGEVNDGNAHYFFDGQAGHAGLFGSIDDLQIIIDLYRRGGLHKKNEFIEQALVDRSLGSFIEQRGLGWHAGEPFPTGVGHTGFTGTSIWLDRTNELTGIILTNRLNVSTPKNINPYRLQVHQKVVDSIQKY
ncbi:serine hydrolase domain-containing protein [Allobacillus sp. GCM10007491]|uniref:Beta-lactamase family protein n=1 Tax=Allobacillus saliphilus TaxID=2912308 RepID=A0A941CRZ5_9BACI|nr:serine hydrolase domain-containing protein [Allobacillus saliphilus]MBR7552619.1 beta-lactamase family protein [Allobacillus saliphilus]